MNNIKSKSTNKEEFNSWALIKKWPAVIFILVFLVWLASWLLIDKLVEGTSDRGSFGDKFGAVNSLFAGLAFAGIIYTILLQREATLMQKEELEMQREELAKTREEFNIQNDTLKKQRFENTFFQMLNLHHEIINSLRIKDPGGVRTRDGHKETLFAEKRSVFNIIMQNLGYRTTQTSKRGINNEVKLTDIDRDKNSLTYEEIENILDEGYERFLSEHQNLLVHYRRHLFQIFLFIDNSTLVDKNEKEFYTDIVRSQLSPSELNLLFYHSITKGHENYLKIFYKYKMFKHVDLNNLASPHHKKIYEERIKPFLDSNI